MNYGLSSAAMISVKKVFLYHENPRHKPMADDDAVIEYLCKDESVLQLARDISKHGLNPLELFALVPIKAKKRGGQNYTAIEGNRRLCALKLLNDPDLAPAKDRKTYRQLAKGWESIPEVFSVVFKNVEAVKVWLDRIHAGQQGGVGRRQWNAEQKQRFAGDGRKNSLAQLVLDYAQKNELITEEQRQGTISIVQRYLSNPQMREALGIDASTFDDVTYFKETGDFKLLLEKFMTDVSGRVIDTRDNKDTIVDYSRRIQSLDGLSGKVIDPLPLDGDVSVTKKKPADKKKKPKKPLTLRYDRQIHDHISSIPSYKLEQLYHSLCSIGLKDHTPLITVGVWSLLETITAVNGRGARTSFNDFLNAQLLKTLGLGDKKNTKSLREAIKRLSENGNTTKHDTSSANFNGEQLANDFDMVQKVVGALAMKASKNRK